MSAHCIAVMALQPGKAILQEPRFLSGFVSMHNGPAVGVEWLVHELGIVFPRAAPDSILQTLGLLEVSKRKGWVERFVVLTRRVLRICLVERNVEREPGIASPAIAETGLTSMSIRTSIAPWILHEHF